MDVARELLNNLMGRDRNKPKGDTSGRDHYSNRDVSYIYIMIGLQAIFNMFLL